MRKLLILIVTLALLLIGMAAHAQDVPPVFCGDLSDDDCTLLTASAEAMQTLESAAFRFQVDVSLANRQLLAGDISALLQGSGVFHVEPGALAAFTYDPATLAENPQAFFDGIVDVVRSISGDLNLTVIIGDELRRMLSSTSTRVPEKFGLSLRLVDGVGYVNLDKLTELDTAGDLPSGWIGLDLAAVLETAFQQLEEQGGLAASQPNPVTIGAVDTAALMQDFTTLERLPDTTVGDGQTAAVFQTTIDVGALYASEAYQDLLRQQMEGVEGMDEEQIDALIELMQELGNMFDGLTVYTTQTIGLDDLFVHQVSAGLDWTMSGELFGSSSSSPFTIHAFFHLDLSQFNDAPEVTAPDNAQIIPLDELLPGF